MDAAIVVDDSADAPTARCTLMRDLRQGDKVVCGEAGVRVRISDPRHYGREFAFMSSEVTSERRVEGQIEELALEMRRIRAPEWAYRRRCRSRSDPHRRRPAPCGVDPGRASYKRCSRAKHWPSTISRRTCTARRWASISIAAWAFRAAIVITSPPSTAYARPGSIRGRRRGGRGHRRRDVRMREGPGFPTHLPVRSATTARCPTR